MTPAPERSQTRAGRWHASVRNATVLGLAMLAAMLGIGVLGYRHLAGLAWIDALLNAAMILGGMGPVDRIEAPAGKLFASAYALASGLVFVGICGVMIAPWRIACCIASTPNSTSGNSRRHPPVRTGISGAPTFVAPIFIN